MARLRLFAGLRQAAGTGEIELDGDSVGEILAEAAAVYGPEFEQGISSAKIWVNGEPADNATPVSPDDEVALLPPVSGGTTETLAPPIQLAVLPLLAWAVLLAANLGSERWFSILVVGVAGAWVWDVFDEAARRASGMARWPTLLSVVGVVGAAWGWSSEGLGVALAGGVLLTLSWSVFDKRMRSIDAVGGALLATVVTTTGVGALVLIRLGANGESRITSLLIMLLVANVVLWVRLSSDEQGFMDPHTAAALATLIAGVATGVVWDTSLVAMVIGAAAVASAFLAGRAFGSALRTGDLYLMQPLPGMLTPLDSAALAASLYWVTLALVA